MEGGVNSFFIPELAVPVYSAALILDHVYNVCSARSGAAISFQI